MLRIGLTGGIGAGKSTVAGMLARRGAAVVDADEVAREVVAPGGPAYDAVVARFGAGVVGPDGALDRGVLASIVFADAGALADLNAITHPVIGTVMLERLSTLDSAESLDLLEDRGWGGRPGVTAPGVTAPGGTAPDGTAPGAGPRIAVAVVPLLRPGHVGALGLRAVVVVDCPTEVAVRRLVEARGMDEADARARVAAQPSREERLALADYVVDNGSTPGHLAGEVDGLWDWLLRLLPARRGSGS